jgi:hypothetical protein
MQADGAERGETVIDADAECPSRRHLLVSRFYGREARLRQEAVRSIAWLDQRNVFVGILATQRIKQTQSDGTPILYLCSMSHCVCSHLEG